MAESVDKRKRNNIAEKYKKKVELTDIWKVLDHQQGIIKILSNYTN